MFAERNERKSLIERWRSEVIVSICKDVTAGGCDYSEHSQSILLASQ